MVNWRDYIVLCKAKVVTLMLLTVLVGMYLAVPGSVPWLKLVATLCGIGLVASSAAVLNHIVDHKIDAIMRRTQRRPLVTGQINLWQAAVFAIVLGCARYVHFSVWSQYLNRRVKFFYLSGLCGDLYHLS